MSQPLPDRDPRDAELRALRKRVAELEARLKELVGPEDLPLEAQLDHLRLVVERLPAVLWTTDRRLRFLSSHGAGLKALGLEPNAVRGLSLFEYFQPDEGSAPGDGTGFLPIEAHRRALAGQAGGFELRWKDRAWRSWVEPLRGRGGDVIGTIGISLDVTEAGAGAEREARLAARFQQFYDQAPVMMHSIDEQGVIRDVNAAWLTRLGYRREDVVGRPLLEVLSLEPTREGLDDEPAGFFRGGGVTDVACRVERKSGSVMDALLDCVVVDGPDGKPLGLSVLRDVTEWKRADEERRRVLAALEHTVEERTAALRETNRRLSVEIHERKQGEGRFRRLVEGLPDHIIYSHGLDGGMSYISPSAARILGLDLEKLRDHFFGYMTEHPANQEAMRHNDLTVRGERQPPYEAQFFDKTGARRWLEISESPVFEDGAVVAVEGIARDITRRKAADDALKESEERFRQLAESIDGVFYITDPISRETIYVSPGFRSLWQRDPVEVFDSPRAWIEAIHPDDRERVVTAAREKRPSGEYDEQYRILRADGTVRWIHDRAFPIEDASGRIYRVVGLADDITALKDVEEALRLSGARLQGIVETVLDAIITVDEHGIVWSFNPAACRMFGYRESEVVGQRAELLFPDTLKARVETLLEWYFAQGAGEVREGAGRRKDGSTFPCELAVTQLDVAGSRMLTAVVRDLTTRRRGEEALLAASRMEATATLAAGVAHDFNNLMAIIQSNTDVLAHLVEGEAEALEVVREVAGLAQQGGGLARQLLMFSRGGKASSEVVDPNRIVQELLGFQARGFPPNVSLERELADDLRAVEADPTQLGQVLLNLVTNAREAVEGRGETGGRVRVVTRNLDLTAEEVEGRSDLHAGAHVLLSVEDDGVGMDPETRARIFEPFYTTKFHGRGLGLAATFGIVRNHGGHIDVTSRPGEGTRFDVILPAAR